MPAETRDLVIVGGGPAGLGAAFEAQRRGLGVTVLEREAEAGGAPRHCGHAGFGMLDMARFLTGPRYAAALRRRAGDLDLRCGHAVTALGAEGVVSVSGPDGPYQIQGRRVLLATGIRETPRAARLISGGRPFGIFTTGAVQRFVYLHHRLPCRHPVVVGTEIVAYSTLLTLRHMGAKPRILIDEAPQLRSRAVVALAARACFGVPSLPGVDILSIDGDDRVNGVTVRTSAGVRRIDCDGVIFSGDWVPEATLARLHPMGVDAQTGGPVVDAHYRTGDAHIHAAGNVLGPVRSSGRCALEGRRAGAMIAALLRAGAGRAAP